MISITPICTGACLLNDKIVKTNPNTEVIKLIKPYPSILPLFGQTTSFSMGPTPTILFLESITP